MSTASLTRLPKSAPGYAGQADYTPAFLAAYDPLVLGIANRFVWRCRTSEIVGVYEQHAAGAHLDVGPGTGWYLKNSRFATPPHSITLLDANPDVLEVAARRLAHLEPQLHQANLLEPIDLEPATFDSIALTHVLHCLPGTIAEKGAVLARLGALLRPGGRLFGATILAGGVSQTPLSRGLMRFLNARGVFGNKQDDLAGLERALAERFPEYEVRTVGSVAIFVAHA